MASAGFVNYNEVQKEINSGQYYSRQSSVGRSGNYS